MLRRPLGDPQGHLRQRHARTDHEGRGLDDAGGGRSHVHHRRLALRGDRRHGQRDGRQAKARQHRHLVVDHQLLRQAAEKAPREAEIRYHLGAALARSGDMARARQELEAAIAGAGEAAWKAEAKRLLDLLP